jgi:hypothetical protein
MSCTVRLGSSAPRVHELSDALAKAQQGLSQPRAGHRADHLAAPACAATVASNPTASQTTFQASLGASCAMLQASQSSMASALAQRRIHLGTNGIEVRTVLDRGR